MTRRFPLIAEALTGLRSRSCIIDGEAVACDDNGLASFERIRYRQHDGDVFLYDRKGPPGERCGRGRRPP
jgi:ATP-dependent DNA ligase